ncbi:hypothetical protein ACJX0J_026015, partial [Zea mays]
APHIVFANLSYLGLRTCICLRTANVAAWYGYKILINYLNINNNASVFFL